MNECIKIQELQQYGYKIDICKDFKEETLISKLDNILSINQDVKININLYEKNEEKLLEIRKAQIKYNKETIFIIYHINDITFPLIPIKVCEYSKHEECIKSAIDNIEIYISKKYKLSP